MSDVKKQNRISQGRLPDSDFMITLRICYLLSLSMLFAVTSTTSHAVAQSSTAVGAANVAYEHGTNSGMRYLAEYGGVLRVTLLLEECGLSSLSQKVEQRLPNSVDWFLNGDDVTNVPPNDAYFAAQTTRAYLFGFEAGVRTEFSRSSPEWKEANCSAAALAANDYISR